MLNMLNNVIILESSMFFHYDHVTMTVSCDICDLSCDCIITLDPNPK